MEQIDEGPQQIVEIVFEPGVGQHRGEFVDNGAERPAHGIGFGQRTRIGLVVAGPVTMKRQLVE